MSGNVRFHAKRAAGLAAAIVVLVLLLIINMTMASGLIPGLDRETDDAQSSLINRELQKVTLEGQFVDRNGDPITMPTQAGEPAQIIQDECYSYLIGHRTSTNSVSGLRQKLMQYLFLGGADGVGSRIGLTTDNGLQQYCYDVLGEREGSVIVMDAHTGELLASTSRASAEIGYDADLYTQNFDVYDDSPAFWLDRTIRTQDPPGSTFKIITAAAMLENDMGEYVYDDTDGTYEIPGGGVVHNSQNAVYGEGIDLETALNKSINVYFASGAVDMAAHRMDRMLSNFRFNEYIVTDFGRFKSTVKRERLSNKSELAQVGFGQGTLTMSPMHISMIMGSVLNDGEMVVPHVVREIYDDGKDRIDEFRTENTTSKVFSPETAATLQKYLHSTAVGYGFTEEKYGMVYAKTGTADLHNGLNHVYMLLGVETEQRDYVILIDVTNVTLTSYTLKDSAFAIVEYILSM